MGLMIQIKDIYTNVGSCVSYTFLYLTLQEFLAAIYWSQFSADGLTTLLKQTHLLPKHRVFQQDNLKVKTYSAGLTSCFSQAKSLHHFVNDDIDYLLLFK